MRALAAQPHVICSGSLRLVAPTAAVQRLWTRSSSSHVPVRHGLSGSRPQSDRSLSVISRKLVTAAAAVEALVTPEWLSERLNSPDVKVLDATWYMPTWGKDAVADYAASRIPGSGFFDTDGVADFDSSLPHMLPSARVFGAAMDALGVSADSHVVLYDRVGVFSSPRAWWTLRAFGHEKVSVLDGGLPLWQSRTLPLDTAPLSPEAARTAATVARAAHADAALAPKYKAQLQADKVRSLAQIRANIDSRAEQLLDARPAGRFKGVDPEPRPGLPSGHIPGSVSVPWTSVLESGQLRSRQQLREVFAAAGVDPSAPHAASCGSGLSACVVALALYQLHGQLIPVYDGSWTEWASTPDTPRAP